MAKLQIQAKGFEELAAIENSGPVIHKHLKDAMRKSVLIVEGDTKQDWPVGVSGQSRNSIASNIKEAGSQITGTVGSSIVSPYPYPATIEYGRKPGKMPPPAGLARWVELVLGVRGEETMQVAFTVARAIARSGIKGKRLLEKAVKNNQARMANFFEAALEKIKQELERR